MAMLRFRSRRILSGVILRSNGHGVKLRIKYLDSSAGPDGTIYYYARRFGRRIAIRPDPGTPAFHLAFAEALEALKRPARVVAASSRPTHQPSAPGTLGWLAAQYFASAVFQTLDPVSQRNRRRIIEQCLREPLVPGGSDSMADCS